jgi:uncharacterized protein (UPF0305 family)
MNREKLEETLDKIDPRSRKELNDMTLAQLEAKVNELAKGSEANDQLQEDDEELEGAKAKASELGRPYREDRKAFKIKSKYAILLIKEKNGQ